MGIKTNEVEYQLIQPFDFTNADGAQEQCTFLLLRGPSYEHTDYSFRIQQKFVMASEDAQKEALSEGLSEEIKDQIAIGKKIEPIENQEEELDKESEELERIVVPTLMSSTRIHVADVVKDFEKMCLIPARKNICMLNGNRVIKSGNFHDMNPEDMLGAAAKWIAFFGVPASLYRKE